MACLEGKVNFCFHTESYEKFTRIGHRESRLQPQTNFTGNINIKFLSPWVVTLLYKGRSSFPNYHLRAEELILQL